MDIEWFGHSCFRLRSSAGSVVADPFDPTYGALPRGVRPDIVTVSHDHRGHAHVASLAGAAPFVIDGPGEYEVEGIFVIGVRMAHDVHGGSERGCSVAYCVVLDDVTVCHLGDLAHAPTQEQLEHLGDVDVLLIPVGGGHTLGPAQAVEVVNLIEPSIIVPMHFRSPVRPELEPVSRFLKEMGVAEAPPLPSLSLTRVQLPEEPQVVLLEPRA
jgi:L-ascorbate metabolism protein UlaG (beta-lactamase superfamily)